MPWCNRCSVEVERPIRHFLDTHVAQWVLQPEGSSWTWFEATFREDSLQPLQEREQLAELFRIREQRRGALDQLEASILSGTRTYIRGEPTQRVPYNSANYALNAADRLTSAQEGTPMQQRVAQVFALGPEVFRERLRRAIAQGRDPFDLGPLGPDELGQLSDPNYLLLHETPAVVPPPSEALFPESSHGVVLRPMPPGSGNYDPTLHETEILERLRAAMRVEWDEVVRTAQVWLNERYTEWLAGWVGTWPGALPESDMARARRCLYAEAQAMVEGTFRAWLREQLSDQVREQYLDAIGYPAGVHPELIHWAWLERQFDDHYQSLHRTLGERLNPAFSGRPSLADEEPLLRAVRPVTTWWDRLLEDDADASV